MTEWFIVLVLNTKVLQNTMGSNPIFSRKYLKKMLQSGSLINSSDNSGVLVLKFIQVLDKRKQIANLGDFYIGSIKELKTSRVKKQFLKKGDLVLSLVVQTKSWFFRKDGQKVRFLKNSSVVFDKQKTMIGSRVTSAVCNEFRKKKLLKFLNLTTQFI